MSADPSYTPKYVETTAGGIPDVPATGPDPYTDRQKQQATKRGEARLEADVNDGEVIENSEQIHADAANYFASYLLHLSPRAPDSATMGDSADEGEGRMDFADRMYDLYESTVESINEAEGDEGEGGSDAEPTPQLVTFGGRASPDPHSGWR